MRFGPSFIVRQGPRCPRCQTILDGATCIGRHDTAITEINEGDFTVCAYCAARLQMRGGAFHELTPAELVELPMSLQVAMGRIRRVIMDARDRDRGWKH